MITKQGPQCDGCDKIVEDPKGSIQFVIPPSGNFGGVASKSNPGKPARMVACPSCWPKILYAIKSKSFNGLPIGRFRRVMTHLILSHGVHNLKLKLREGHA